MNFSFVIPLLNEAQSLRELVSEIYAVAARGGFDGEVILVDDGSSDHSWSFISELAAADPRVRGIRLRRNFGKSAALAAGVRLASHDWIVMLDADLQDDVSELPKLWSRAQEGFELVNGWKQTRRDPWSKRLASRVFNWLVNRVSGMRLHDHNCGFKLLRREIFEEIQFLGDWHRFIPVLAEARGWRVTEVAVNHRPRKFGRSKYGVTRLFKGLLDLVTIGCLANFHHRPQTILGSVGLASALAGGIGMAYLAVYWLIRMLAHPEWTPVHERPLLLYSLGALLIGVHLLALGFLAELIVAHRGPGRSVYSVAESTPEKARVCPPEESIHRTDPAVIRGRSKPTIAE
jgi:dolichol-phosphate mannosyltransferase